MNDGEDFDEYEVLIGDCQDRHYRLSSWEKDFLDSIQARTKRWDRLSEAQVEKLYEIWERVT